ncbi:MAG: xanthine dehydrogenase family protein subunit M [Thermodesulfobacteriota bacterium]
MRIRPFEYREAAGWAEALDLVGRLGPEAKVLAGGTDLVLALKEKKIQPRYVISLHRVRGLDTARRDGSMVRIGALARHADLAADPFLRKAFPGLCQAVGLIGSWQIRNVGTLGGNLCNASPAADSAPPLLALDARVVLAEARGEAELPLAAFFTGPGLTVLQSGQLLKEVILEIPPDRSAGVYLKLMRRRAVDLSLVGVALQAEADPAGGTLSKVAIGLGGVAPTPIRAPEAEAVLAGLAFDQAVKKIPEAARAAVAAARPIDDVRASAAYRRSIIEVFVQRAAEVVLNHLFKGKGGPGK